MQQRTQEPEPAILLVMLEQEVQRMQQVQHVQRMLVPILQQ